MFENIFTDSSFSLLHKQISTLNSDQTLSPYILQILLCSCKCTNTNSVETLDYMKRCVSD